MDPVQFLKCISFFSLDRIIIYWNKLYDLRSLVGLPVWFCWTTKYDCITPLLHWLPVEQRIVFKILLLIFKSLNDLSPCYIRDLLQTHMPSRKFQSPRSRLKFYGDRAFSVCAPKLWNNLPEHIKCCLNLTSSKRNLKTYLFKRYFNL